MQIHTMSQADEAVGCEPGDVVVVVREQESTGRAMTGQWALFSCSKFQPQLRHREY